MMPTACTRGKLCGWLTIGSTVVVLPHQQCARAVVLMLAVTWVVVMSVALALAFQATAHWPLTRVIT